MDRKHDANSFKLDIFDQMLSGTRPQEALSRTEGCCGSFEILALAGCAI